MIVTQSNMFSGTGSTPDFDSNVAGVSNPNTGSNYLDTMLQLQREANAANLASARETNEFNAREAQKNRDWQEYMSNTAIQRQVDDMIKAGINPILAVMNNGASTPGGSSASGVKANFESGVGALASIISSSINASTQLQIAKINAKNNLDYARILGENNLSGIDLKGVIDTAINTANNENYTKNTYVNTAGHVLSGVVGAVLSGVGQKVIQKKLKGYR